MKRNRECWSLICRYNTQIAQVTAVRWAKQVIGYERWCVQGAGGRTRDDRSLTPRGRMDIHQTPKVKLLQAYFFFMKVVLPTWFFFHNWNDTLKHERGVLNFYLQRFACTSFLIIPIWILNREFLHEDRGNNPPYQSTFGGFEQFSGFNNLWGIPTK